MLRQRLGALLDSVENSRRSVTLSLKFRLCRAEILYSSGLIALDAMDRSKHESDRSTESEIPPLEAGDTLRGPNEEIVHVREIDGERICVEPESGISGWAELSRVRSDIESEGWDIEF